MAVIMIQKLASDSATRILDTFKFNLLFVLLLSLSKAWALDGYDYGAGNYVEIDKGNLVRPGEYRPLEMDG